MLALAIVVCCCCCVDIKRVDLAIAAHEGRLKEIVAVIEVDAFSPLAARERRDDDVVGRRLSRSRELVGKIIMVISQSMLFSTSLEPPTTTTTTTTLLTFLSGGGGGEEGEGSFGSFVSSLVWLVGSRESRREEVVACGSFLPDQTDDYIIFTNFTSIINDWSNLCAILLS